MGTIVSLYLFLFESSMIAGIFSWMLGACLIGACVHACVYRGGYRGLRYMCVVVCVEVR